MTWHPGGSLADQDLTVVDGNGFEPCPFPGRVWGRTVAAQHRGEVRVVERRADGVAVTMGRLRVIVSASRRLDDGHVWIHVSVSRTDRRLADWTELVRVRDVLLGDDVEAYQVAPPRDRYVNRNPGVLHLWADLEGPALPAFEALGSDGGPTI